MRAFIALVRGPDKLGDIMGHVRQITWWCPWLVLSVLCACAGATAPVRQADGSLSTCQGGSDCVRSGDPNPDHAIEPLRYAGRSEDARRRLLEIVLRQPRTRVVVSVPNYLHVEVAPSLLGSFDDLEFLFSPVEPRIDIRAARRGGGFDSGANRSRIERIRAGFDGH